MIMKNIKLGVIGAGMAWEKLHYPAFQRLRDKFSIAAICDRDMDKARRAAGMVGLGIDKAFDSYQKMMNSIDLEAIDIMVPIDQTHEVAMDVIAQGKHIILEKPFAATLSGAKDLLKHGKKVKILLAENFRYEQSYNIMKDLINQKAIGNVVYFIDNHVKEYQEEMLEGSFPSTEWRQHPDFKGGIFLDEAVHHMAGFRFLFGHLESVYAHGRRSDIDFCPYSCINALLRFEDQIVGHYTYYCIAKETQAPLVGLRIFGTNGEIYLEEKDCGYVNCSTKDGDHHVYTYQPQEGYYNELLNFYEAVANDMPIISTPEKGLGDMSAVFDILRSIEINDVINSAGVSVKKFRTSAR
jgi:predicted dehydrogenase